MSTKTDTKKERVLAGETIFPLSFSSLARYSRCPFDYYTQKTNDMKERSYNPFMESGRIVHEFIADYLSHIDYLNTHSERFISGSRQYAVHIIAQYVAKAHHVVRNDVRLLCETFVEKYQVENRGMTEVHLASSAFQDAQILEGDGHKAPDNTVLHGHIDRLEPHPDLGWANVIDFKTGFHIWSRDEIANDLQLRLYSLLTFLLYPDVDKVVCSLYFVRYGFSLSHTCPREALQTIIEETQADAQRILDDKEFLPSPGSHCHTRCESYKSCPLYQKSISNEYEIPTVLDAETAARLAVDREMLKRRQETIDGVLRAYTETHGFIKTPDGNLGHHTQLSKNYTEHTQLIVDHLRTIGIPIKGIWSILTTSKSVVNDLLITHEKGREIKSLDEMIPATTKTSFRTKKGKKV